MEERDRDNYKRPPQRRRMPPPHVGNSSGTGGSGREAGENPRRSGSANVRGANDTAKREGEPPQKTGVRTGRELQVREDKLLTELSKPKKTGLIKRISTGIQERKAEKNKKWENDKTIERVRHGVDRPLFIAILILLILGTVMIFSASYPSALTYKNDAFYYIRKHLKVALLGFGLMIAVSFVPYKFFRAMVLPAVGVTMMLLVLVLIMGVTEGEAKRWIIIGPVSFQPSEIAKITLVLALAAYFEKTQSQRTSIQPIKRYLFSVVYPLVIMGVYCGLVVLEKHLSGTMILGLIACCIIFLSGAKLWQMIVTYVPPAAGVIVFFLLTTDYALSRITSKFDETADRWQTTQGLYAIGSGGVLGQGLGQSNLKFNYVSQPQNDFIFSIWCEEMGFVGAVAVIVLFGFFVWRGFQVARKAPDTFSSLTAFGITCHVAIQAILNILVVTDIMFNTGVSLPFFSCGGTATVIMLFEMGILLSVSRHSYQKKM